MVRQLCSPQVCIGQGISVVRGHGANQCCLHQSDFTQQSNPISLGRDAFLHGIIYLEQGTSKKIRQQGIQYFEFFNKTSPNSAPHFVILNLIDAMRAFFFRRRIQTRPKRTHHPVILGTLHKFLNYLLNYILTDDWS